MIAVFAALTPAIAAASSGDIYSASESQDGLHGAVSGSVTWDQCSGAHCHWQPIVIVQPAAEGCRGEYVLGHENTHSVWTAGVQSANETLTISSTGFSAVIGQQACLDILYTNWYVEPLCVSQYEVFRQFDEENHLPPPSKSLAESCPETEHVATTSLGGRPFIAESLVTPAPITQPSATSSPTPSTPTKVTPATVTPEAPALTQTQKLTKALRLCRHRWRSRAHRKVACERQARRRYQPTHLK
jgi:hypothetical protein